VPEWRAPRRPLQSPARCILPSTYRDNDETEHLTASCNSLVIFRPVTSVSWRKVGFFVVRYKKIAFSPRPCGGPYDASRVCVVARAYQPRSRVRVTFSLSLSLSLSFSLSLALAISLIFPLYLLFSLSLSLSLSQYHVMNFCVIQDKKIDKKNRKKKKEKYISLNPPRER